MWFAVMAFKDCVPVLPSIPYTVKEQGAAKNKCPAYIWIFIEISVCDCSKILYHKFSGMSALWKKSLLKFLLAGNKFSSVTFAKQCESFIFHVSDAREQSWNAKPSHHSHPRLRYVHCVPQRALWWLKHCPHNTMPPRILLNCQLWACAIKDLKERLSSTTNMDTDNNFEVEEKPAVILKTHRNPLYLFLFEHEETRLASKVSLFFRKMETLSCPKPFKKSKHPNESLNRSAFF